MNADKRVLARMQARDLTKREMQAVSGGIRTASVCSFSGGHTDGDTVLGECLPAGAH